MGKEVISRRLLLSRWFIQLCPELRDREPTVSKRIARWLSWPSKVCAKRLLLLDWHAESVLLLKSRITEPLISSKLILLRRSESRRWELLLLLASEVQVHRSRSRGTSYIRTSFVINELGERILTHFVQIPTFAC